MQPVKDYKCFRSINGIKENNPKFITGDGEREEYYKGLFEKLTKENIKEKKVNKCSIECVDPVERYNIVPLHAIFLYSSQHEYLEDYIKTNWGALSSMSKDDCDIYFSTSQLDHELDAFDAIDQICAEVDISKLPGMLFWESKISDNRFLSFRDLSEKDITYLLLTVFQQIRTFPTIDSIAKGEELFKAELLNKKAPTTSPSLNVNINIKGPVNSPVVGYVQGDFINDNGRVLDDIFTSLEWNEENKKRIEELERTIEYDKNALKDIQSSINKLVEANATDKLFTSKLKNFATNISTGISSSLIASAIFTSLSGIKI
jgi:hypothetical protein